MEFMSERERYENGNIPRELEIKLANLAIQLTEVEGDEDE